MGCLQNKNNNTGFLILIWGSSCRFKGLQYLKIHFNIILPSMPTMVSILVFNWWVGDVVVEVK
jgi:hypothetical protein